MTYQIGFKKSGIVMLMEDSELRASARNLLDKIVPLKDKETFNSKPGSRVVVLMYKSFNYEIMSLLDKCKHFNVNSQKWSKPAAKAHIAKDTQDLLKQAVDMTMERLETWSPKSWADLVKELQCEMKVAYEKFINLRKKYYKLIETCYGNQGSELIKAYIARDILDYVMYGINISLQFSSTQHIPTRWITKIKTHFEMLARELEGLNVGNEEELRRFAEDVSLYKQCMLDIAENSVRSLDESNSKAYMMLRQRGGVPFSDLIERKINELGFAHQFKDPKFNYLNDSDQHEVYQGIINQFGGENTSKVQFVDFLFCQGRTPDIPSINY